MFPTPHTPKILLRNFVPSGLKFPQTHHSPGRIPGCESQSSRCKARESATVLLKFLRPALGGVFPSGGAHGLRRRNGRRRRNRNARRGLRPAHSGRQSRLRRVCPHLFFLRKQRSHQPQGFHFFLQTSQFHF